MVGTISEQEAEAEAPVQEVVDTIETTDQTMPAENTSVEQDEVIQVSKAITDPFQGAMIQQSLVLTAQDEKVGPRKRGGALDDESAYNPAPKQENQNFSFYDSESSDFEDTGMMQDKVFNLTIMITALVSVSFAEAALGFSLGNTHVLRDFFNIILLSASLFCSMRTLRLYHTHVEKARTQRQPLGRTTAAYNYGYLRFCLLATFINCLFLIFSSFFGWMEAAHYLMESWEKNSHVQ